MSRASNRHVVLAQEHLTKAEGLAQQAAAQVVGIDDDAKLLSESELRGYLAASGPIMAMTVALGGLHAKLAEVHLMLDAVGA